VASLGRAEYVDLLFKGLLRFARSSEHRKPFCIAIRNPQERLEAEKERLRVTQRFLAAGIPVFKTIERACRALYRYTGYYRALEEAQAPQAQPEELAARCCAR
jgi:acyl-CoA synthetase (NDP forming)